MGRKLPHYEPVDANHSIAPALSLAEVELSLRAASGNVPILRGVSLEIAAGQTVAVVGPSGSGKTSLLMVAAGLEAATGGSVRVAGHELRGMDEDTLARFRQRHIGIVFQSFHLVPTMTALENVALPLELGGERDAWARAEAALGQVGLVHRLTHYPSELSGGEQQRVAIARAVVTRPALLFADEPTGNLDGATGAEVIDLLFRRQKEVGSTLILITHDPALASRCERVIRMADGRIANEERAA